MVWGGGGEAAGRAVAGLTRILDYNESSDDSTDYCWKTAPNL